MKLRKIINYFRKKTCKHVFEPKDMVHRNQDGIVKWPCSKCGKIFEATYGLKILENGTCSGNWGAEMF